MKKFLTGFIGVGILLAACQTTETAYKADSDGGAVVTISLSSPDALEATKAAALGDGANSAKGGFTNLALTDYDIRYQLAVYRDDDSELTQVVAPQLVSTSTTDAVTLDLRLTPNYTYCFVAWADFVPTGTTDDYHYSTEDFTNIYCLDGTDQLNDESRDAYFATYEQEITADCSINLSLLRPFAKLRIVTNDYDTAGIVPDAVSVCYYGCTRFSSLNALTGAVTGETLADSGTTVYTGSLSSEKEYSAGVDAEDAYRTIVVDYLLAQDGEQDALHFTVSSSSGSTEIQTVDVSTSVPIQRNYLTTVSGSLLTVEGMSYGTVTVTISETFTDEYSSSYDSGDDTGDDSGDTGDDSGDTGGDSGDDSDDDEEGVGGSAGSVNVVTL